MNKIVIDLIPTPAPRPRVSKRGHAYYPQKYLDFRAELKREIEKLELNMVSGAIKMDVYFYMPIPKSYSKKKKVELEGTWHVKKPDRDNLLKGLMDGLEGYLYKNDSQVCTGVIDKIYSRNPRIEFHYQQVKNPNYLKENK